MGLFVSEGKDIKEIVLNIWKLKELGREDDNFF